MALCFALGMACSSSEGGSGASPGASGASTSSGGSSTGGAPIVQGRGGSGGASVPAIGGLNTGGGSATGGATTGGAGGAISTAGATLIGGSSSVAGTSGAGSIGSAGRNDGTAGTGGAGGGSSTGGVKPSDGCGKDPTTLKSATVGQASPVNTISGNRQFLVRWPANYDNKKAYPLHIGLHGHGGNLSENGKDNFGLWSLSKNTVIFVTLAGVSGNWDGATDVAYSDAVLEQVESELCIDSSRIILEGFSQGGAMAWYLTGAHPGVFRAVVGHSGGGVSGVPALSPVAYLGTLGTSDVSGNSQATQTDQFAKVDGCTIETLPTATTGKHGCTPYKGCKEGFPVTWCSYDGGHGFQDTDAGSSMTWVPQVVWDFLSPMLSH
ncbi:MAG TPA: hypothetical protein VFK05_37585 [Polyangiaceae bacterium]|nr:hypothetical protein [Polyangiaceae bacterium]